MTEPVAYLINQEPLSADRWLSDVKPIGVDNKQITPLYTANQLHPRVKMTQAEFDEWKEIFSEFNLFSSALVRSVNREKNINLFKCIYLSKNNGLSAQEKESRFAKLWADYDPDNPEETIEIVNNMKWFVRSKELNLENNYYYFVGKRPDDYWPTYGYKRAAKHFDTKEEAEKWKNPDTEAVQLPVDGE